MRLHKAALRFTCWAVKFSSSFKFPLSVNKKLSGTNMSCYIFKNKQNYMTRDIFLQFDNFFRVISLFNRFIIKHFFTKKNITFILYFHHLFPLFFSFFLIWYVPNLMCSLFAFSQFCIFWFFSSSHNFIFFTI